MRIFLVLTAVTGCAGDPEPLDPLGTYRLSARWGAGDCGKVGNEPATYRVVDLGSTFGIADVDAPDAEISGTVFCDSATCDISFSQVIGPPAEVVSLQVRWTLQDTGLVAGNGTLTVNGSGSCLQQFSISGRKE